MEQAGGQQKMKVGCWGLLFDTGWLFDSNDPVLSKARSTHVFRCIGLGLSFEVGR